MWLVCSDGCGSGLFRALFAEVDLDAGGVLQSHRITQPGFVCLGCGAPAVDLGRVPAEMAEDEERKDSAPALTQVLCPVCETLVEIEPGEDCPRCGAVLELEAGA